MSSCPESYAGITVPEGEPAALNEAAGQFGSVAAALSGVAGEVRGAPSTMASWAGPASVSYAGACMTNGSACDAAVEALGQTERAARAYADKLQGAQERAREAIADARDAQERIDTAEREITAAQDRQRAAVYAQSAADAQLAIASTAGLPDPTAEAARGQAQADYDAAALDESRARRELERAQDDLARAKRRGREAMDDGRDAAQQAAAAFGGAASMSPVYAAFGAPGVAAGGGSASPSWWNTRNEGRQWWDEDQFASQMYPFHPENDTLARSKWFGDRALDFGLPLVAGAAVGYGGALRNRAIQSVPSLSVAYGRQFIAGRGGTVLVESLTVRPTTTTVIDSELLARAGTWGKAGKAIPVVGTGIGVASAGWDQWRKDAENPNLTTTDRVGRSAGVGIYVGGAAAGGAAIGTMIFPGVGTLAGAGIGAAGGLVAGAVASSIEPAREFAADAGQWVANAGADTWDTISNIEVPDIEVPDIDVPDIDVPDIDLPDVDVPDVDLPDLNPF
jgi:uncharacterized protein YukE